MAQTFLCYTLEELMKEGAGIMIRTQEGCEVMIRVEQGKTLITLPYGNDIGSPENVGVLSKGLLVTPKLPIREQLLESLLNT